MQLAAQQLIHGNTVCLAGQIPQSDLNTGDAAALTGMAAELLDLTEDLIHITGIFANDSALEHQRIGLAGCVTNFTITTDALIGLNFNQGAALRCAVDIDKAHISNSQIGGIRICIIAHNLLLLFL